MAQNSHGRGCWKDETLEHVHWFVRERVRAPTPGRIGWLLGFHIAPRYAGPLDREHRPSSKQHRSRDGVRGAVIVIGRTREQNCFGR